MRKQRSPRHQADRRQLPYDEADIGYPAPSAYIPATQARWEYGAYRGTSSPDSDHRGRITSVLSLLLSIVIVALSFGGFLLPPIMIREIGSSDAISALSSMAMGAMLILIALLLQAPTILLALRAASTKKGHVGRGRGIASIILSCLFPMTCLLLLLAFATGWVKTATDDGVLPQIVTGTDGKPQIVMPEGATGAFGDIMGHVNELADEGYSMGFDGDGNLIATDPNGQTVTITSKDLAEIGIQS